MKGERELEIRSYEDLKSLIREFYKTYSDSQLRYFLDDKSVSRPSLVIPYCSEKPLFSHILEITIPGKKTFEIRKGCKSDFKQKNDIKITLITDNNKTVITHEEIIKELYKKVSSYEDESLRCEWYKFYRTMLTVLYDEKSLNSKSWFMECETIYFTNIFGNYKIPVLISFIRWCAVQEMINYPCGWGRDLCFARYFEAIYAGLLRDEEKLNKVIERANSNGSPQPLDSISELQGSTKILEEKKIQNDIYNNIKDFACRRGKK